jgi:hypothetical protein
MEAKKYRIDKNEIAHFVVAYECGDKTDKKFIDFFLKLVNDKCLCHKVDLGQKLVDAGIGLEDNRNS